MVSVGVNSMQETSQELPHNREGVSFDLALDHCTTERSMPMVDRAADFPMAFEQARERLETRLTMPSTAHQAVSVAEGLEESGTAYSRNTWHDLSPKHPDGDAAGVHFCCCSFLGSLPFASAPLHNRRRPRSSC